MNDENDDDRSNRETIDLIAKWICIMACIGAAIYFASIGNMEYASGFGFGAIWGYWIMF